MTISYSIAIDYNDNGSFSDLGDAISAEVLELSWRLGMAAPYERLSEPARAEILLRNLERDFSPEVAGNLIGKRLRIQSNDGTTIRTHFLGAIAALEPEAGQFGKQGARLLALGREAELYQQKVRLPLLLNFTVDLALAAILQQVQWRYAVLAGMCIIGRDSIGSSSIFPDTAIVQNLATGASIFPYLGDDWAEGLPAQQALEQLMTAEAGRFFFNRAGEAIFYQRYQLLQDNEVVASFDDTMTGLAYRYGGDILNQLEVAIRPRSVGAANSLIWELANPVKIRRESSIFVTARYTVGNLPVGAVAVKIPQRGTDFQAFREADGSGAELTAQIHVILREAGASAAVLEIRNLSRPAAYLSRLELYGTPLFAGDPVSITIKDAFSSALYGAGTLALNIPILAEIEEAEAIAQWELSRRNAPQGKVREIRTNTIQHPLESLALSLFDRIRIVESQTGHDATYHIVAEEHQVSKGGTVHEVSWLLEAAEAGQFFIIGTHSIGDATVVIVPR